MHFWKFNRDIKADKPAYVPTFEEIVRMYQGGYHSEFWNVFHTGIYRYGGWAFEFWDELKKFVVKTHYGDLTECWAPNRTLLRKCMHTRVEYILDVPK